MRNGMWAAVVIIVMVMVMVMVEGDGGGWVSLEMAGKLVVDLIY